MTNTAILAASALLVFAYLLEIFGRRTRIPAVVLLVGTGMVARQVLDRLDLPLHWVDPLVPVIGTFGLILIVLEGSLDLSLQRERLPLILRASLAAVGGFIACVALLTAAFCHVLDMTPVIASIAAMPFAVISSAVAIPSARGLPDDAREFVIYESSLSDIVGILAFYAWLQADGSAGAFARALFGGGLLSAGVAVVAAVGLVYLIDRIEGHVRFLPLLAGLVLIYAVGKALHLSPLIVVLACGLLLNNAHLLQRVPQLRNLAGPGFDSTLEEFKGLVAELTFAVKSFFFLMLGYWTDVTQMVQWQAWAVTFVSLCVIYTARSALLAAIRQRHAKQLLWFAPRGLITVLLFLTAADGRQLDGFPFGAVMLIVLLTASATALAHRRAKAGPADLTATG